MTARINVLITGGLGFQGRYLTEALTSRGHDVTVLAVPSERARSFPPHVRIVWGSVTDPIVVRATVAQQDVIVHMAAMANPEECADRPRDAVAVNVGGTQTVLEALLGPGTSTPPRLVHVSSCEVYGPPDPDDWRREHCGSCEHDETVSDECCQDESSPMRPPTIYAASKCAADRLVYAYVKTFGVRAIIVRPCNIYGPGQKAGRYGGVIPMMVGQGMAGHPIRVRGDGTQSREFMHVADVTGVYVRMVETEIRPEHGAVNISVRESTSVGQIAQIVAAACDVGIEYVAPRPGEVQRFDLDTSEARRLGLIPDVSRPFRQGLEEYIVWARTR